MKIWKLLSLLLVLSSLGVAGTAVAAAPAVAADSAKDPANVGVGCFDIGKQENTGYWGERCDKCCNRMPFTDDGVKACKGACRKKVESEMNAGTIPKYALDRADDDNVVKFEAGASCAKTTYKPTVSMESVCKSCCKTTNTSANSGNPCMNGCRAVYTNGMGDIGVTCGKAKSATECSQCCSTQFGDADLDSACKTFAKCSAIKSETSDTAPKGSNMAPSCDAAYNACMSQKGHTGCQKARANCKAQAGTTTIGAPVNVPPAAGNVGRVQAAQNCNKVFQNCKKGKRGAALQACNQAKADCVKAIP